MNLKDISTVDLATELLTRAENMDTLLALVSGTRRLDAGPPSKPMKKTNGRHHRMTIDTFLSGFEAFGRPASAEELAKKLCHGDKVQATSHLWRAQKLGKVEKLGERKPHLFQLVKP